MTPRPPQPDSEEEAQPVQREGLSQAAPEGANRPAQDAPASQAAPDTTVEIDRAELYFRGPTAFSA